MAIKTGISQSSIDKVLSNLNREIKGIENRTQAGLTAAGMFVRGEAQKRTPVDTGNLRNSAYVITPGGKTIRAGLVSFTGTQAAGLIAGHKEAIEAAATLAAGIKNEMYAEIGFTAFYAVFVHEIQKNYNVGDWKFLERALFDNKGKIIQIIKNRARVKK